MNAVAFLSIPVVRSRYGARAQAAVEAELGRQGVRTSVMAENGMRLDAGGHETWAPSGSRQRWPCPPCSRSPVARGPGRCPGSSSRWSSS